MVFPTYFILSLTFSIRIWWSEPQPASSLLSTDCINFPHCIYVHTPHLLYSSVSGHLGCFYVFDIVNSSAMNIGVYAPFWIRVFLFSGYMPKSGIAGSYGKPILNFLRSLYYVVLCILVTQSCLTLCNTMDCSPPGSSVHGILQARILDWVDIPFSRRSSQPRDWSQVSCIADGLYCLSHQYLLKEESVYVSCLLWNKLLVMKGCVVIPLN